MKIVFLKNSKKIAFLIFLSIYASGLLISRYTIAQTSIIDTAQKSIPSIVTVEAENVKLIKSPGTSAALDKKTGRLILLQNIKTNIQKRAGAGVIIDPSGIIVTNLHTIINTDQIKVTLHDGAEKYAKVLKIIPQHDFALIKIIPPYPLQAIRFADSNQVKLKDNVINIGHSSLLNQTLSGGKVTGIGTSATEKLQGNEDTDIIRVDIALYKGDSGGPLIDSEGQLIGLMAAKEIKGKYSSFAIPSNKIRKYYLEYLQESSKTENE